MGRSGGPPDEFRKGDQQSPVGMRLSGTRDDVRVLRGDGLQQRKGPDGVSPGAHQADRARPGDLTEARQVPGVPLVCAGRAAESSTRGSCVGQALSWRLRNGGFL